MAQLRVALTDDIPPGKYHIVARGGHSAVQQLLRHLLGRRAGAMHGNGIAAVLLGGLGGKALALRQAAQILYGYGIINRDGKRLAAGIHLFFGHHYGHGAGLAFCVNMIHHNTSCKCIFRTVIPPIVYRYTS